MFETLLDIINKFIPNEDEARKAAVQLEKEMTKQMELRKSIIEAEQINGSGRWRVRLMYLCMFFVGAYFIMYDVIPYIRTAFDLDFYTPQAPDSEHFWTFLEIGVGGYIGSRGVEKSIAHFRSK